MKFWKVLGIILAVLLTLGGVVFAFYYFHLDKKVSGWISECREMLSERKNGETA